MMKLTAAPIRINPIKYDGTVRMSVDPLRPRSVIEDPANMQPMVAPIPIEAPEIQPNFKCSRDNKSHLKNWNYSGEPI